MILLDFFLLFLFYLRWGGASYSYIIDLKVIFFAKDFGILLLFFIILMPHRATLLILSCLFFFLQKKKFGINNICHKEKEI